MKQLTLSRQKDIYLNGKDAVKVNVILTLECVISLFVYGTSHVLSRL